MDSEWNLIDTALLDLFYLSPACGVQSRVPIVLALGGYKIEPSKRFMITMISHLKAVMI